MRTPSVLRDRARWIARTLRRKTFDNRRFWNRRYIDDPEKGSGPGSRGDNLQLKSALIRSAVETHRIKSVLDIGCGDIAPLCKLEVGNYVGVDISDVVVERNRLLRPKWRFVCADLAGGYFPPSAELTLCLDVLIHQRKRRAYLAILSKALASAEKFALISGYTERNPGWNVYFHEPVADSIRRLCPNSRITRIAQYRGTDLLEVKK